MLTETSSTDTNPFLVRGVTVPAGPVPESSPEEIKPLPPVVQDRNTEPPIELFESQNGYPYAAEVFDIKILFGHTGQEDQVRNIDKYVLSKIESDGLKSTKEAYASIIKDVEKRLGVEAHLDYPSRIEKVYAYTRMLQQEQELKQMRRFFNV